MSRLKRQLLSFEMGFDAFQKPLPKVPVPELKETLNKYLQCIKPIVSDEQYACTQKCVDEFGKTGGLGEYLQRKLIEYAETRENWVSMEQGTVRVYGTGYWVKKVQSFCD